MRLDTGVRFAEAIQPCRSVGFVDAPAYIAYPDRLGAMIVFLEVAL
jgi:hypothetical protein